MPYTPSWQGQLGASQYQMNPYLSQNPYQPVMSSQTVQPYQQPMNGTTQVSGPESALQYGHRMPPNSTSQALFNTNGKVFYIVSTDGAGMPTLETFDFSPHVEEQPVQIDGAQFVSRQEFEQFTAKVNAALGALNGVHEPVSATGTAGAAQGTDGTATLHDAGRPVSANLQPRTV